jgi:broad specificity phosphatase PhoE
MMRLRHRLLLALLVVAVAPLARADEAAWAALARGGVAVIVRHAITEPGIGDPPGYRIDDCRTQRNLSAAGRAQAQAFGRMFAARGVRIDAVWSSRWCRCVDTARLAFPQIEPRVFEPLNSFFDDRATAARQTEELRAALRTLAPPRNLVLVTHMVNIAALTGQGVAMGEALVLKPGAEGALEVIGRLAAP